MGSQSPYPPPSQPPGWNEPGQQAWQAPTPPAYGPSSYGTPQPAGVGEFAGFWRRFAAYFIDGLVIGVVFVILLGVAFAILGGNVRPSSLQVIRLIVLLIDLAYFGYFWSQRGQTLGMMALGIRVVDNDGNLLGFGRAFVRFLVLIVLGATLVVPLISAFMVAFGQRKQGLHDLAAGSLVVRSA